MSWLRKKAGRLVGVALVLRTLHGCVGMRLQTIHNGKSHLISRSGLPFVRPGFVNTPPWFLYRLVFSYEILTPAALNFFVSYAEGAVESLWSIDQYFQFVLVLMLSTGLSFQVWWAAAVAGWCWVCVWKHCFVRRCW